MGAAQGSYVLYNMRDKIRETAGLISSNDWIVFTSNPDLFSYKDGILFSMDQDGASTSLGTDNPDVSRIWPKPFLTDLRRERLT